MALAAPANASAPAPAPAPPSLGPTFGVLYIGATLATVLYGFTTNQAFLYYKKYGSEDGIPTRLLVSVYTVASCVVRYVVRCALLSLYHCICAHPALSIQG